MAFSSSRIVSFLQYRARSQQTSRLKAPRTPRASVIAVLVLIATVVTAEIAWSLYRQETGTRSSKVVASGIGISHDFSTCSIQFVNEGNLSDTTKSVLIFYLMAGTNTTIVRNADPSPSLTLPPGGAAEWDCASSFAGSPQGSEGGAVHVVVSAVVSRERDSVGNFT